MKTTLKHIHPGSQVPFTHQSNPLYNIDTTIDTEEGKKLEPRPEFQSPTVQARINIIIIPRTKKMLHADVDRVLGGSSH